MTTSTTYAFRARGGHVADYLRNAFEQYVFEGAPEPGASHDGRPLTGHRVVGLLWNCGDIMPRQLCDEIGVPQGSTYARGARTLRREGIDHAEALKATLRERLGHDQERRLLLIGVLIDRQPEAVRDALDLIDRWEDAEH